MKLSQLFAAATLLLAVLISAMLAHILAGEWRHYRATRAGAQALQLVYQAMLAAEKVSLERGPANALLGGADQALYRAKKLGRNRVECALTASPQ